VPEVHVPHLDDHDEEHDVDAPAAAPRSRPTRGKSLLKIVLEVALISTGVFLGLAGEQWRENARHRELAEQALRRFRSEITANKKAIEDVRDYHADRLKELNAYFRAAPDERHLVGVHLTKSANPAFVDRTAWDLALATQSLTYIDADLAYTLSSIYSVQAVMQDEARAFLQAMFIRPPVDDGGAFFGALQAYFGDASLIEPRLLMLYEQALQGIDKALGDDKK
jgi:hypothetical protein